MVPLEFVVNRLAYPSGTLVSFATSPHYKWILCLVIPVTLFYVIGETLFYFTHLDDLNESTACLGTMSFTVTACVRVSLMLARNRQLKSLVDDIRRIHKARPRVHYLSPEAEKWSKIFSVTLALGGYTALFLLLHWATCTWSTGRQAMWSRRGGSCLSRCCGSSF